MMPKMPTLGTKVIFTIACYALTGCIKHYFERKKEERK